MTRYPRIGLGSVAMALCLVSLCGCVQAQRRPMGPSLAVGGPDKGTKVTPRQAADVQVALGRSLEKRGEVEQAAAAYREAIKRDPQRADAHVRLAILSHQQGKPDEAAGLFRKALALKPGDPDIYCDMGYSMYLQRRWAEAETNLRQALKLAPNHARAHNNLGLVLAHAGRGDEALAAFRKGGCPGAEAHANLAFVSTLEGSWAEARTHYERALAVDPSSATAKKRLEELNGMLARMESPGGPGQPLARVRAGNAYDNPSAPLLMVKDGKPARIIGEDGSRPRPAPMHETPAAASTVMAAAMGPAREKASPVVPVAYDPLSPSPTMPPTRSAAEGALGSAPAGPVTLSPWAPPAPESSASLPRYRYPVMPSLDPAAPTPDAALGPMPGGAMAGPARSIPADVTTARSAPSPASRWLSWPRVASRSKGPNPAKLTGLGEPYVTTGVAVLDGGWPSPARPSASSLRLKRQIEALCGDRARDVQVKADSSSSYQIQLKVRNAAEGGQLSTRILQMPELERYQVLLDVQVTP